MAIEYLLLEDGGKILLEIEGSYILETSTLIPGAPTITAITSGDRALTVSVTAASESLRLYAIYKLTNKSAAWTERDVAISRVGSGDITIPDLSNGTEYDVIVFHMDESDICYGTPSNLYSGYPDADPQGQYRHDRKIYQRDEFARAYLQVAKDQGELMTYRNSGTGTAGVTVYGIIVDDFSRNVGVRQGNVDEQEVTVTVPRQTNFPPDNFDINATIEVDGNEFQVLTYTAEPSSKTYAATFTLTCSSIRGQEGY